MSWVDQIKEALPEYAKDIKLNLDSVIKRSTLTDEVANACALAAAFATGNGKLVTFVSSNFTEEQAVVRDAALTAASLMAMTNSWYPFVEMADDPALKGLPAQLRMNAIASHIVGKCEFCVKAHYDTLKKEGYTVEQLRDIGRIASVINSAAKVLNS